MSQQSNSNEIPSFRRHHRNNSNSQSHNELVSDRVVQNGNTFYLPDINKNLKRERKRRRNSENTIYFEQSGLPLELICQKRQQGIKNDYLPKKINTEVVIHEVTNQNQSPEKGYKVQQSLNIYEKADMINEQPKIVYHKRRRQRINVPQQNKKRQKMEVEYLNHQQPTKKQLANEEQADKQDDRVVHHYGNYVQDHSEPQQSPVKRFSKPFLIKIAILAGLLIGLISAVIFIVIHFATQNNSAPEQNIPNSDGPLIPVKPQVLPTFVGKPMIVERIYEENESYHLNFTINTNMSSNYSIRINYTCFFVVLQKENGPQNSVTNFGASMQKRSEERIASNGTVEEIKYYDSSTIYEQILKNGVTDLSDENSTNSTEDQRQNQGVSCEEVKSQLGENIKCMEPVLNVFNFSLLENGKIGKITFPSNMQRQELGLIRTFIKMFSPLLDKYIYDNNKPQEKQKTLASSHTQSEDNQTQPNDNKYSEKQLYTSSKKQDATNLKIEGQTKANSDQYCTNQKSTQESQFSKQGKIKKSSLSSDTEFITPENEENNSTNSTDDNITFVPETQLNLNVNFSSHQQCYMTVVQQFVTDEKYVKQFESFLQDYDEKNQTMTVTVQGLINYIIGIDSQERANPGEYRLLLQKDGSLSIIKYQKKVTLLKTVIIGFKIGAFGYAKLNLNLYQDPKNPYKKNPIFKTDVGTILGLGSKQFSFSLLDYKKQLPPLTLKYTLTQLESVMDLVKGGFIQEIIEISKMLLNGNFQDQILPMIGKLQTIVSNLTQVIGVQINNYSPIAIINEIYGVINSTQELYQNKGLQMITKMSKPFQNLSTSLVKYTNSTFQDALSKFTDAKTLISQIREQSLKYFIDMKASFLSRNISKIEDKISSLIPSSIYDKYSEQIKKAQVILDTISYVSEHGLVYVKDVKQIISSHENNLLKLVQNVMTLYFHNQTLITDVFEAKFPNLLEKQLSELKKFNSLLSYKSQITTKSQSYLNSVLSINNIGSSSHRTSFSNQFNSITNSANGAKNEAETGCCKRKKFIFDWGCSYWNDGSGYQQAQPQYWSATKAQIQGMVINAAKAGEDFITQTTQMLRDTSKNITQKYIQLRTIYSNTIGRNPLNITLINNAINTNINQANDALNRVRCGGTGNLVNVITSLNSLKSNIADYNSIVSSFNSAYSNIINTFDIEIYTLLLSNSQITVSSNEFLNTYNTTVVKIGGIFQKLKVMVTDFNPVRFIENKQYSQQLFALYQQIIDFYSQQCSSSQSNYQQIKSIRAQYTHKYNQLKDKRNSVLQAQIDKTKNFLSNIGTNLYKSYLNTPFCEISAQFSSSISKLYPDFHNFTVIFNLWHEFKSLKSKSEQQLTTISSQWQPLLGQFYQLCSPEGYKQFINKTGEIAEDFVSNISNISLEFASFRQSAKQILIFEMATPSQLQGAFKVLSQTQFTLSADNVYPQIQEFIEQSLGIIGSLSFDIINVVVAGNNIKQHFNNTLQHFNDGITEIRAKFLKSCQQFVDLNKIVTQDYLNNIDQNFKVIMNIVNETIFPNVTQGIKQIHIKFSNYRFQNLKMKQIFDNSFDVLEEFGNSMEKIQSIIYQALGGFVKRVVALISQLEIASLNSLYQLANTIEAAVKKFGSQFKQIVGQILDFPKKVKDNFNNIFRIPDFINGIKSQINSSFQEANQTITNKIQQTVQSLKQNSKFYQKLESSPIRSEIKQNEIGLQANFDALWNSAESNEHLSKINDLVSNISASSQKILSKLSNAQNSIKGIRQDVEKRVEKIKEQFQIMKRKLFNLKSLIFVVLQADLGGVIMGGIRNIMVQVDGIVNVDFFAIGQLAGQQFKVQSVQKVVNNGVDIYNKLKDKKNIFLNNMQKVMTKVDSFLHKQITQKVQKLKSGILSINSQPNLENPVQTIMIYGPKRFQRKQPIAQYKQLIPTAVGTFMIDLNLNYSISAQFFIELTKFRNIELNSNFSASLILDVTFGYGIAYILEFGLFVKGNVLRADLMPKFILNNVIPVQLVKAIAQIPELEQENKITVYFITDFAMYAVQLDVGFYIKYISIQLIWKPIKICIHLLFINFCISFKIPIGFKFNYRRKDWGKKISGVTLAKKRIIDLKLLQFTP